MRNVRNPRAHSARAPRLLLCALLVFLLACSAVAQTPDLDVLASRLSGAILAAWRGLLTKPSVLVMDFTETHGGPNELGAELALEFSKSLAKDAQDFWVAGRDSYFDSFRIDRSLSQSRSDSSAPECFSDQPKPTIVVDGYIDSLPDRIVLRIKATRTTDEKIIFDERIALPLTPELQSLQSKPFPPRGTSSNQEVLAWVSPDFHVPDGGANAPIMNPADKSYTLPRCLECPRAEYPDSALTAKIQGRIEMRILIDAEGRPARIIILKGLPCGLDQKAIETVARWKLAPAKGPDGKPLPVWQDAEMSFQLF